MIKAPNGMHVGQRMERQQLRIGEGVKSGALTPGETAHLERREARLARSVGRDVVDGGDFTARERAKAQLKLNSLSKDIFVQKHDGQVVG